MIIVSHCKGLNKHQFYSLFKYSMFGIKDNNSLKAMLFPCIYVDAIIISKVIFNCQLYYMQHDWSHQLIVCWETDERYGHVKKVDL